MCWEINGESKQFHWLFSCSYLTRPLKLYRDQEVCSALFIVGLTEVYVARQQLLLIKNAGNTICPSLILFSYIYLSV